MKQKNMEVKMSDLFQEYAEDDSIFNKESDRLRNLKHVLWHELNDTDRRILLLYCETGNLRDAAKLLNVSASTLCIKMKTIRKIFLNKNI